MGFFPDDYKSASADSGGGKGEVNPKYWEFAGRYLGDGESISFRPCGTFDSGHVVAGWQYFTMEGRVKRFTKFPRDFESDIGLTWAGKNASKPEDIEALKAENKYKDKPKYFLAMVAYFPDRKDWVCVTALQKGVREQIESILDMEDYTTLDSGCANFTLTVKRKGQKMETTWNVTPTLKKPTAAFEEKWSAAKDGIWLPALFDGADCFAGKPAESKICGLPPMKRDALGADKELVTSGMGEDW